MRWPHPLLGLASLFSGAALVIAVWFGVPLSLTLACTGLFAVLAVATRYSALDSAARRATLLRLRCGLVAGLIATAGYDLWRLLLVKAAGFPIHPFETFRLFGLSIAGADASLRTTYAVGTLYHVLNGVTFGIGYLLLFPKPRLLTAVIWALGLELAMFTVYPGWLDLEAVMMEFTVMSLSGHLVYGGLLGIIGARMFVRGQQ